MTMPLIDTSLRSIIIPLLGLIVGSFASVVVARFPKGKSVVKPASHCPKCKTAISWYDNIPLISYLLLGGRCRKCKTKISLKYPIIEAATALIFLAAYKRFGWDWVLFVRDLPLAFLFVVITFIDLEHRIIPDVFSLGGLVLGLTTSWAVDDLGVMNSFLGALIGFGFFYLMAWLYQVFSGKVGLGGGDIKLLAMIGAFLGPSGVLSAVLIGSIFGTIIGVAWAFMTKQKSIMASAIPFGPFLVLGALYFYLLGSSGGLIWFPFTIPM